jgi:Na+-transporting NADH:ubiquinone oxidoreductase subunit A
MVATPTDVPKAVFVSGFDSAPLAPDLNFALEAEFVNMKRGFEILRTLAAGRPVHLSLSATAEGVLDAVGDGEGIVKHTFAGPHPAGNVGVQISRIDPINKGDRVWTTDLWSVALIGRFFNTGRLDMTKIYAVAGSGAGRTGYVEAMVGTPIADLVRATGSRAAGDERLRFISGNALSGRRVGEDGYIGFYANMLTVLPEGDRHELLGWARPGLNKFSVSRTYLSWLRPGKRYVIDTNLHGGHRPFIVTGLFERYVPMDIYPMQLLKAILAEDIDKMEALGIYEVVPEDLALCEFADPSKNDIQQIVQDGIDLMVKEVG